MTITSLKYESLNLPVLGSVPVASRRILDVGCGTGALGHAIKSRQRAEVIGITSSRIEAEVAAGVLDHVFLQNLNTCDLSVIGEVDCVICSHVLEHLQDPASLLRAVVPLLIPGGRLIVALPNILVWRQRARFLMGEFRYTEGWLMDNTHLRFFDWSTAHELIVDNGFEILTSRAIGVFPGSRRLPGIGVWLDRFAVRWAPGLFGWQFLFEAVPRVCQL